MQTDSALLWCIIGWFETYGAETGIFRGKIG